MAKLSYRQRKRLKSSQFAIPSERKYPIEDKAHARNALARVSRFGSRREKAQVRRAVHNRYPSIDDDPPRQHDGGIGHMHIEGWQREGRSLEMSLGDGKRKRGDMDGEFAIGYRHEGLEI